MFVKRRNTPQRLSVRSTDYSDGIYFHYTWATDGNRLTQETVVGTNTFAYDDANRLVNVDDVAYTWDDNGNLLNDGVNTYTYDSANRLLSVTDGVSTTSYAYNGDGDRIAQTVDGVTTFYEIDTALPLTMVLAETSEAKATYYLHGLDLVAQNEGLSTQYFAYDGLGSVRQVLDSSGSVLFSQAFDPYGNPYASVGTDNTNWGFTGEQTDANGLVFLRVRYFSPKQGRFFTRDPFSGSINYPATLNPYLYGLNNPVLHVDPSGENPLLAALLPALVGLGATMAGGAIAAGTYGYLTYGWAISGECGCDIQQQALSMTKWEWAGMHALSGGIIAGTATTLAVTSAGMILVGGVGVVVSLSDFFQTVHIFKNETGITPCIASRLFLDVAGTALGVVKIREGIKIWRANGSGLSWSSPPLPVSGKIDPNEVRFSQDSISYRFKNNGGTIDDLANGLRSGQISPNDVPPIRLVERNGKLYTGDYPQLNS